MSDNVFSTKAIVLQAIRQMEQAKDDSQKCWAITLQNVDILYSYGEPSIDNLISLLPSRDQKIVILAILYLGILNDAGLNGTKAIGPIRSTLNNQNSLMMSVTCGLALAMLGDADHVQAMKNFMKNANIPTVREFNRGGIATVIKYIATGKEPE
jgi:hypothetical protein